MCSGRIGFDWSVFAACVGEEGWGWGAEVLYTDHPQCVTAIMGFCLRNAGTCSFPGSRFLGKWDEADGTHG